jgi:hypothetical protein
MPNIYAGTFGLPADGLGERISDSATSENMPRRLPRGSQQLLVRKDRTRPRELLIASPSG